MKFYESEASIDADPVSVWAIITDAANLSNWDSGVDRVEGRIVLGETIKVFSKAAPGRAFPVKVTGFDPNRKMVWSGGMPLGLFKGVRTYSLTPNGDGTTHFKMREEYTGPLLGMIWKSMPDLQPSFDQYARGLKAKAEAGTS